MQLMTKSNLSEMTHPLTDEIIKEQFVPPWDHDYAFDEDDLRSAADWQLEQVIEWLKDELDYEACLLSDLKEAMRPQEDS